MKSILKNETDINRCCNCGKALMKTKPKKGYFGKNRRFHDICEGVRLDKHNLTICNFNFVHKGNEKIPNDDEMRKEAYTKYLNACEYVNKKKYGY
jgi:hypothetical protein